MEHLFQIIKSHLKIFYFYLPADNNNHNPGGRFILSKTKENC